MYQKIALFLIVGIFTVINAQSPCGPAGGEDCQMRCQNETSGGILPVATICEDTRTDCGLLFNCTGEEPACEDDPAAPAAEPTPGDPTTNPKVRPTACDAPGTQDVAMECAKTCMICCETPEYNCEDDDTGVVDCQANIAKCKDANWTDIMAQYCPASCGLCLEGACADLNAGCNGLASLCRDIDFHEYMKTNCARTCDACPTTTDSPGGNGSCTDNASNCAQNANLCSNDVYFDLMQQQCACTCQGASNGGGSSCTDSNSNCVNWVRNGFCDSTFYNQDQKREYCASSCNLC